MKNKTVIITGATSGIGKATAYNLANKGAKLVLVSRNQIKLKELSIDIKSKFDCNIDYLACDLSSLEDVRKTGSKLKEKLTKIDVLLNNAGVMLPNRIQTVDGFECTLATNHLGHFLLTGMLVDIIKNTPNSRIINVSSAAHKFGKIDFDDLMAKKKYSSFKAYSQSKLANVLFTQELARKLENTTATVNSLHPGVIKSGFGSDFNGFFSVLMKLAGPFMLTAQKGAETSIFLASSNSINGSTGEYFVKRKQVESVKASYDKEVSDKLWKISEDLCNIRY